MIKNGKGGSITTKNGGEFEKKLTLYDLFIKNGYQLELIKTKKFKSTVAAYKVLDKGVMIGFLTRDKRMYKDVNLFLGANIEGIISKELKPDEAFIDTINRKVYILEKKFQSTDGSTDEKLETCDFKKKQYEKLFVPLGYTVEFMFVCCDFFKDEKYTDVVKYIKSVGCQICFSKIPFESFGLPKII